MQHLVVGTRVCAYWSQKYHHLYPGTISDMEIDPKLSPNDYVNVELDDGDNRDIHVNSIRFLPSNYPLVGKSAKRLISVAFSCHAIKLINDGVVKKNDDHTVFANHSRKAIWVKSPIYVQNWAFVVKSLISIFVNEIQILTSKQRKNVWNLHFWQFFGIQNSF